MWDLNAMAGGGGASAEAKYNSYKAPGLRGAFLEAAHVSCLEDRYALGPQLGWGQFGVIRSCSDLVTGEALACKSIAKDRLVSPAWYGALQNSPPRSSHDSPGNTLQQQSNRSQ